MFDYHQLSGTSPTPYEFALLITSDSEMATAWLGRKLGESLRSLCLTAPALSTPSLLICSFPFSHLCAHFIVLST